MKKSKMKPRWSMVAMLGLAVGSGYWVLAGGCAPSSGGGGGGGGDVADEPGSGGTDQPDGQGGTDEPDGLGDTENLTVSASSCVPLDDQAGGFEIKVEGVSKEGRELSYTRRLITPLGVEGFQVETEVMADDELVFTMLTTATATTVQTTIEYGPAVSGAESVSAMLEDGMLTGSVDDRSFVPVAVDDLDTQNVALEDGQAAPQLDVDANLQAALEDLFAAAANAANDCEAQAVDTDEPGAQASPRIPDQDTGHDSDPEESVGCVACWFGCGLSAGGCIGAASAGCAALFICPPCLVACEVIAVGACTAAMVGCEAGCNATGAPCCPVSCGSVACCESGETCLNSSIGLCCSPGKTPCVGEACCSSTESCIGTGPNAGTCCQPEDICGNTCCDPTDSCLADVNLCCPAGVETCDDKCCAEGEICLGDGVCCDPGNACGNSCCDELDDCIAALSLCCGFNEPACGSLCCASGETCIASGSCCPTNLACGSFCCPNGMYCDSDTLTCIGCPNATDTPCNTGNCCPAGMNCTDNPEVCCPQGQMVCNATSTNCVPYSDCVY